MNFSSLSDVLVLAPSTHVPDWLNMTRYTAGEPVTMLRIFDSPEIASLAHLMATLFMELVH